MGRWVCVLAFVGCALTSACLPAAVGGRIILSPHRALAAAPLRPHHALQLRRGNIDLDAWLFRPQGPPRGLVVYLHGRNGNRELGARVADRLLPAGFAVLAYDQRGHGRSGGRHCTYGYYEKHDLIAWVDALGIEPVYVVGHSTGAAVALQAAAIEPRIRGVVSLASFARLDDVIREQLPPFARGDALRDALASAEREAHFDVDAVAPELAARSIHAPVLLIHGTRDDVVPSSHALRIWRQLPATDNGSLLLIEGAGHSDLLERDDLWERIRSWMLSLPQSPQPQQPSPTSSACTGAACGSPLLPASPGSLASPGATREQPAC
ncbi:MAG: alpha/beta hydrolase [Myxococcaceae bacterium]|nr:alpha/beta hydrolase [Myxococcaceae bacterium]MCI0673856.1 alpha/beta hydrolase [Myxococcaceae bacterium]